MSNHLTLNEKEKELIAVGASIAAGCQPCTAYHIRAARASNATDEEIRQAVNDAMGVRHHAAQVIAGLAEKYLGGTTESDGLDHDDKPLLSRLVSLGAAFAINCVTTFDVTLAMARQQGATDRQILATLQIANAVKKMANRKIEAAVVKAFPQVANCDGNCDCLEDEKQPSPETPACGCAESRSVTAA